MHYCDTVWGYTTETNIKRIDRLKHRAARIITGVYDYNVPCTELLAGLCIMPFKQKRDYNTACLAYRCINEQSAPYLSTCFRNTTSHYNTRSNPSNVHIYKPKKELGRQSLYYNGPKIWNNIDDNIRNASSVGAFKKLYKAKYLH